MGNRYEHALGDQTIKFEYDDRPPHGLSEGHGGAGSFSFSPSIPPRGRPFGGGGTIMNNKIMG